MPTLFFDLPRQAPCYPFATGGYCNSGDCPNCGHRTARDTVDALTPRCGSSQPLRTAQANFF